ncbi:hypothetical protein Aduo_004110 [Ancylostoma duodenale]
MGAIGFTMSVIEIREILRLRNIYLFKYFSLSHAIIHAAAQLIVVVLFIPSGLVINLLVPPQVVGYTALALQCSSLYTSITMSLNRMISVYSTFTYSKIFTKLNTLMIIIATWSLAFSSCIVLLVDGCGFVFDATIAEFYFEDTKCGRFLSFYADIVYNSVLLSVVIPMDMFSLYSLHKITQRQVMSTRRIRRERPWFVQTLLNSTFFALMLACFHTVVFADTVVARFFLTIVAWEAWLMSPQILGIILQKEYRIPYLKLLGREVKRLPTLSTTCSKLTVVHPQTFGPLQRR